MLFIIGTVAVTWSAVNILSNAFIYLTHKPESYEQFLYRCFPNLDKLTEAELNHIQKLIGEDPRIPGKHKWIW